MRDKENKLAAVTAAVFEIIIIATLIMGILNGSKKNIFLCILAAGSILIPFATAYIAKRKAIVLPDSFNLIFLLFILSAQYFGELLSFYYRFWWWDLLLHGIFGIYSVLVGAYITRGIISKTSGITEKRFHFFITVFAFSFSMTLGILWELFEFVGDYLFKTNMMKEGLTDTMTDLISSSVTAFSCAVVYYIGKVGYRGFTSR